MKGNVPKNEYVKLLRISRTGLRRELKKPAEKQDAGYIEECVENIAFCEKELYELRRERASARGIMPALRRVGAAALALVFCFALFATVSEAAGFRVWTAIIKRDAGYLRVDYVPNTTSSPAKTAEPSNSSAPSDTKAPESTPEPSESSAPIYAEWEDAEKSCFSREEFDRRLTQDGLTPFSSEFGEYRFLEGSIRSTSRDYYATYTLMSPASCVRVRMIAKSNDPEPVSVWGMKGDIPYTEANINGIPVTYQVGEESVFATWQVRGCIFCASLFDPDMPVETILASIVG
jgi:hypothetical protein